MSTRTKVTMLTDTSGRHELNVITDPKLAYLVVDRVLEELEVVNNPYESESDDDDEEERTVADLVPGRTLVGALATLKRAQALLATYVHSRLGRVDGEWLYGEPCDRVVESNMMGYVVHRRRHVVIERSLVPGVETCAMRICDKAWSGCGLFLGHGVRELNCPSCR